MAHEYFLAYFLFFGGLVFGKTVHPQTKGTQEKKSIDKSYQSAFLNRDVENIYSDNFEGENIEWTYDSGWQLTESDYNSPSHSFNSPNDVGTRNDTWDLISPTISLSEIEDSEIIHFKFSVFCDMIDSDGDDDGFLEDYYSISMMDPTELAWHASSFNAYEGMSYWCGKEEVDGYLDSWLQYLDTPSISIPFSGYELKAQMAWGLEDPEGATVAGSCTDGWDAANVRISTDGGTNWDLLAGTDAYDFDCGYGWIWNDAGYESGGALNHLAPGWGGQSDWHEVTFNLNSYAGEEVIIRFAFGSDPAYSTPDDPTLIGFRVDNIIIENSSGDELFSDNADDFSEMTASGAVWVDQFYDYWDDGSLGGAVRPGSLGWEEYLPGLPFNGNVFLDITEYAGKDVIFRIQSRYDENDDGGQGLGLFIDDMTVYKYSLLDFPPENWLIIDNDGDSTSEAYWNNWVLFGISPHSGNFSAASASWSLSTGNLLTPDNWLISPEIFLTSSSQLRYWIAAQDLEYPEDHYSVMLSTTGQEVVDFAHELYTETLQDDVWRERVIDLSSYGNNSVHIAWRHYDCSDKFIMKLDDVMVSSGTATLFEEGFELSLATEESLYQTPVSFTLYPNYPNPFNPSTTLKYSLPFRAHIYITIYDLQGRYVNSVVNGIQNPGVKSVIWSGKDSFGRSVSAGIYLYKIQAGDFVQTRKMVLLK